MSVVTTDRLQMLLSENRLDVLVLRTAENILAVSGYWPAAGFSCAIITERNPTPLLVIPDWEKQFVPTGYTGEIKTFNQLADSDGAEVTLAELVKPLLHDVQVGFDTPGDLVSTTHFGGEVRLPSPNWLLRVLPVDSSAVDCTESLLSFRMTKSATQLDFIRRAQQFALKGLQQALHALLTPGTSEIQLASRIESEIQNQLGEGDTKRIRAWAQVQAGLNTSRAMYSQSSPYKLRAGDLVVIELATVVDGYWSDITRTVTVGDSKEKSLIDIVRKAQQAAIAAIKPGAVAHDVDAAARAVLGNFSTYYPHALGHGVGFAYHEPPFLTSDSVIVLSEGMVLTVAPGIYIPNRGGARIEDNIWIRSDGVEVLSAE